MSSNSGLSKNFFSKTSPDLVSLKSLNDINNDMFSDANVINNSNNTGCFNSNIYNFYKKYIQPNLIAIIVIILFIIIVIYRYLTYKKEEKQDKQVKQVEQFDPSKSIQSQINRNVYIGDQLDPDVEKTPEMIEASSRYNNITHILDDSIYDDTVNNIGRSNYIDIEQIESVTGLNNRWNIKQKDNDYLLDHPLGYDNDFVETTGDSIQFANNQNRKSFDELAKKMFED
jgi:hypothetical protein